MPFGGQIGVAAAPAVEKKLAFLQTFCWLAGIGICSGFDRGLEDHTCSTTQLARSGCRREEKVKQTLPMRGPVHQSTAIP
jgi:hypothetical protein